MPNNENPISKIGDYFKFKSDTTALETIGFFIILPFMVVFACGVLLWWLVIQFWKVIESIIFRENLFRE